MTCSFKNNTISLTGDELYFSAASTTIGNIVTTTGHKTSTTAKGELLAHGITQANPNLSNANLTYGTTKESEISIT